MNAATNHSAGSIQQLLIEASRSLQDVSDTARLDAEVLLADALELDRSYLFTWPEREPPAATVSRFLQNTERRRQGVPVAYLTGTKEFWSMNFRVTSDTLIPRTDTETLVQLAIDRLESKPGPVLDLGTGCGAIAISIARECHKLIDDSRTVNNNSKSSAKSDAKSNATIEIAATDNSVAALNIARENARQLNARVSFYLSNWFTDLAAKQWQLIVSNPPYLGPDDSHLRSLSHEPQAALVAADNGLCDIIEIIQSAKKHLRPNGTLMLEHGAEQGSSVRTLMQNAGYHSVSTETDLANRDRVTLGQLHE